MSYTYKNSQNWQKQASEAADAMKKDAEENIKKDLDDLKTQTREKLHQAVDAGMDELNNSKLGGGSVWKDLIAWDSPNSMNIAHGILLFLVVALLFVIAILSYYLSDKNDVQNNLDSCQIELDHLKLICIQ